MKKYLVFVVTFIVLLTIVQIGSGLLLTALYTKDVSDWSRSANGTAVFGLPPIVAFAVLLPTATWAYGISRNIKYA